MNIEDLASLKPLLPEFLQLVAQQYGETSQAYEDVIKGVHQLEEIIKSNERAKGSQITLQLSPAAPLILSLMCVTSACTFYLEDNTNIPAKLEKPDELVRVLRQQNLEKLPACLVAVNQLITETLADPNIRKMLDEYVGTSGAVDKIKEAVT